MKNMIRRFAGLFALTILILILAGVFIWCLLGNVQKENAALVSIKSESQDGREVSSVVDGEALIEVVDFGLTSFYGKAYEHSILGSDTYEFRCAYGLILYDVDIGDILWINYRFDEVKNWEDQPISVMAAKVYREVEQKK